MPLKYDYTEYTGFKAHDSDRTILKDPRGVQRTENLFIEMNKREHKYPSLYTLQDVNERRGLPSAFQIYMHSADETEAAMKIVGSLKHWDKLCNLIWFMKGSYQGAFEGINKWREYKVKLDLSVAKNTLMQNAAKGDTAAARKILDEYKNQVAIKREVGRPKKDKKGEESNVSIFSDHIAKIHAERFGNKD